MRSEAQAQQALDKYADTVRRICFLHLKNQADVEDVFQDVFLKYILRDQPFDSDAHEKAWLLRVAINACKDTLKSFFRKRVGPLSELAQEPLAPTNSDRELWEAVYKLPPKYRNAIFLFYYEGYSAVEIAHIIGKNENTVYTWLSRAKTQLRTQLGGDFSEE